MLFVFYSILFFRLGIACSTRTDFSDLRQVSREARIQHMREYCNQNTRDDLIASGVDYSELHVRQPSRPDKPTPISEWEYSMHPSPEQRINGLALFASNGIHGREINYAELDEQLRSPPKNFDRSEYVAERRRILSDSNRGSGVFRNGSAVIDRFAACSIMTYRNLTSCSRALNRVDSLMDVTSIQHPRTEDLRLTIGMPSLYMDVMSDETLDQGIKLAAIKMLEKVRAKSSGSNVLADLVSSFKESGLSQSQSEEAAWKVMGLYGTGGAALGLRARAIDTGFPNMSAQFKQSNPAIATALGVIGTSLNYLDALAKQDGRRYALPEGVQGQCDQGKNYHFWMAAYLSRQITRETNNPASSMAVFTAHKGYQYLSTNVNRPSSRHVIEAGRTDPITQTMRIDIAYAAAGAVYGQRNAQGRAYSVQIDDGINDLIDSASGMRLPSVVSVPVQVLPPVSYALWSHVLTPDRAFRFFQNR